MGNIKLDFTPAVDATLFRFRRGGTTDIATDVALGSLTDEGGGNYSYTDNAAPEGVSTSYQVFQKDAAGNEDAGSNIPSITPTAGGGDVTPPVISGFAIADSTPTRINFNSSEIVTATTFGGFTLGGGKTVTAIFINAGNVSGHYFTVNTAYVNGDGNDTIAYSGTGSNLQDTSSNALAAFTATTVTNNVVASGSYDPLVSGLLAIKATAANPTDQSASARTTSASAGNTLPTVSGGNLVFDGTNGLTLSSTLTILSTQEYTGVMSFSLDDFTPGASKFYHILSGGGFYLRLDTAGFFDVIIGTTTNANVVEATTIMVAGEITTAIIKKNVDGGGGTIQFDSPTSGLSSAFALLTTVGQNTTIDDIGDYDSFVDRELKGGIRGIAFEPAILTELTTPKLSEVQTYTEL